MIFNNLKHQPLIYNLADKLWRGYFIAHRRLHNSHKLYMFQKDFQKFKEESHKLRTDMPINWKDRLVCLDEDTSTTSFDPHYIYHTAWAARILAGLKPKKHVDISSYLYFGTIISAFIPVDFYDYRPISIHLPNYRSKKADLLSLPFKDNSISSLSSMHVLEHIGLGRYGDKLDPLADVKAAGELVRVLKKGGSLLVAVPVGKPKVVFNAHRIYNYQSFIKYFQPLQLKEFTLLPDNHRKGVVKHPDNKLATSQHYGCGCFWFQKYDY